MWQEQAFFFKGLILLTWSVTLTHTGGGCDLILWARMHLVKSTVCFHTEDTPFLYRNLLEWRLPKRQILQDTFPLDEVRGNFVRQVRKVLFSQVEPTPFRTGAKLAAFSAEVLTEILNLEPRVANSSDFIAVVSGARRLGEIPALAHRYGGHQFGVWAGQLGDGRAHLIGEYENWAGERWELQLKGSGLTPYSRRGDGRAVIRSSVREFLASEAMFHLGIPTSRAASLVVSEDRTTRDPLYNGHLVRERCAVVLRLAKSWFRIGSLEILADNKETGLLKKLADFVISHYFPQIDPTDPDRYLALYAEIVSSTAVMMVHWQAVGFTHGVCNTDNFSLLSITIDYGPFRFMDEYDPDMVPNTSDDEGRYRYSRQPSVGEFNLRKLMEAMSPLLTAEQRPHMATILKGYWQEFQYTYGRLLAKKLGITGCDTAQVDSLTQYLLHMMAVEHADFTLTFRQMADWTCVESDSCATVPAALWALKQVSKSPLFPGWAEEYWVCVKATGQSADARRTSMNKVNPRYVLRNWMAQEAITAVERDDFTVIERLHRVLKRPFEEQLEAELAGYADPPPAWAKTLRVSCSS